MENDTRVCFLLVEKFFDLTEFKGKRNFGHFVFYEETTIQESANLSEGTNNPKFTYGMSYAFKQANRGQKH